MASKKPLRIYCCVFPMCNVSGNTGLFKFPKDPELKSKWLAACQLSSVKGDDKICKRHFHPSDILTGAQYTRVKKNAVPSWYTVSYFLNMIKP